MDTIINYVTSIPVSTWIHLGEFLVSGGAISVLLQLIKHFAGLSGQKKFLSFLNGSFAAVAVAGQAYLSGSGALLGPLTKQAAALAAASAFMYRVSVSPLYKKIVAKVEAEQTEDKKIALYNEEHPLPETNTTVPPSTAPTFLVAPEDD